MGLFPFFYGMDVVRICQVEWPWVVVRPFATRHAENIQYRAVAWPRRGSRLRLMKDELQRIASPL